MKVLITGGATGIGEGCVKYFARKGHRVFLHYNSSCDKAVNLKNQLVAEGCDVHLYQADLSSVSDVQAMVQSILRLHKGIDVLINNAGRALYSQLQDISEKQYHEIMDVNCRGTFFLTQAVVKGMLNRGSGSIVNVSSIWGVEGGSCESLYCMSKHALVGLTRALHEELSESGIAVNCICPAVVETAMTSHLSTQDKVDFAIEHNCKTLTTDEVAEEIYNLATSGESGIVKRI